MSYTAIEIEVFGALKPDTEARTVVYTIGEKTHCIVSSFYPLSDKNIEAILDSFVYAESTSFGTRYFLKEWL